MTPFYIRKDIETSDRLISTANSIRSWSVTPFGLDPTLKICYLTSVDLLPKCLQKPTIPRSFGDLALWGDFDEVCPQRTGFGHEGWKALGFQKSTKVIKPDDSPLLLRNLSVLDKVKFSLLWEIEYWKGIGEAIDLAEVNLKPQQTKWQVVRPVAVQWESFGGWLPR